MCTCMYMYLNDLAIVTRKHVGVKVFFFFIAAGEKVCGIKLALSN